MKFLKDKQTRHDFVTYAMCIVAFAIVFFMQSNHMIPRMIAGQLVPITAYIVMAISLNLVVGIAGDLSLGHAGFMSVGAYTGIVTAVALESAVPSDPMRLIISIVVGAIAAAILGFLIGIPVLRLSGDYLAIVTLAFGEIIKEIVTCLIVGVDSRGLHVIFNITGNSTIDDLHLLEDGTAIIKGAQGASGVSTYSTFLAGAILVMVALVIVLNLVRSRTGRAIMAVRDNKIAAESVGISVTEYRMIAFVVSAALAGAAGALFGGNFSQLSATKFDFNTSILILVFVVLGGLGNMRGSVIAAALLTVLPELLRQFSDYRMLIYAIVLILVMILPTTRSSRRSSHALRTALLPRRRWQPMPSKFEFNKGKMVPYPSGAIVPDRDLGQRPALECIHLGIEFGGLKAVDDFSLTIGKTEIAGLIGPNGAGKTTVFNLLTKVYQPTHGTILLDGEDTSGKSVYQVNRMGIARTFQNIRLFNTMTVEDNVKVGLHNQERYSGFEGVLRLPTYWKHEKAAHERAMELLSIFDMEHLANEQAGSLPYGAQRRLEIVRALATNPKLLLLDEPAAGMNPSETAELMENIVKIRDTFGIAIMLIEHDMSLVMNICEGICVLNFGKVIAKGTAEEIQNNDAVIEAYLGKQDKGEN